MTPTVAGICIGTSGEVIKEDLFDLLRAVVLDVEVDGVGERAASSWEWRLALFVCSSLGVGRAGMHVALWGGQVVPQWS